MAGKKNKKKSSKPIKVYTLDTETRGLFGGVFRIGLYDGDQAITTSNYQDIKTIFDKSSETHEVHVFIHNLDFDLAKLAGELMPGAKFSDSIFINNNVAVFRANNIVLHDSLKLLPASLEKLSKSFKLEDKAKIDLSDHLINCGYAVDKNNEPTTEKELMDKRKSLGNYFSNVDPLEPELNEYLVNDLISLYEIIMQVKYISGLDLDEFINCPTTASLAMRVFKSNYEDDYKEVTRTNWRGEWARFCEEFVRQGYYGGRTEVFKPALENGFHYDVNSLYPSVMKDNEYPVGFYNFYEGSKADWCLRHWWKTGSGAGFAEIEIHIPENIHIPPLPVRHANKLLFPVGNLSGVWTFPEIKNAVKYGGKIKKIKQVLYFKRTAPVFRDFVEDHAEIKMTSTGAKREFAKLMQNSLYGKFGMNRKRKTLLDLEDEQECKDKGYPYMKYKHPLLKKEFLFAEIEADAQYIQPHIAAYVTSLARLVLYEALVTQENTSYCDTDSIACGNAMLPENVDPNEYGKWDLESVVEKGIYLQPKLYFERNPEGKETVKAKGIPGDILQQFTGATYERILNDIKSGADRVEIFGHENEQLNVIKGETKVRKKFTSMIKSGQDMSKLGTNGEEVYTSQVIRKGINLRAVQKRRMDFINNTSQPHAVYHF